MYPKSARYLLANSCLNTTHAPIKTPKTKHYNSRYNNASHFVKNFDLCKKVKQWINENTSVHAFLGTECDCMLTSVTSPDTCALVQHCVCACVFV